jgi:hypothetical protein
MNGEIRGHPGCKGGDCRLVPGHEEPHRPVHVIDREPVPQPILNPRDLASRYPDVLQDTALTLLAEAGLVAAGDQAETLGVFLKEKRDPVTGAPGVRPAVQGHPPG